MHSGGSRRAACSPISGRRSLGTDGLVSFRSQSLFYGKRHKRFLTPYYIPCAAKSKEGFCIKFSAPARGVLPRHLSSLSGGEFAETASKRMLSPRRCKVYRKKREALSCPALWERRHAGRDCRADAVALGAGHTSHDHLLLHAHVLLGTNAAPEFALRTRGIRAQRELPCLGITDLYCPARTAHSTTAVPTLSHSAQGTHLMADCFARLRGNKRFAFVERDIALRGRRREGTSSGRRSPP